MEEEGHNQSQHQTFESDRRRPSSPSPSSSPTPLSSTSTMNGRERNTRPEVDAEEEDSELEKMMEQYPRFMAFWDSPSCACVRHTLFYIGSYFPVLLISALFCVGYYLFVHVLCVTHLIIAGKLLHLAVFLLFLFHFLFLLAVISFLRAVFSDPGYVQPSFHSQVEERVLRDSEEDEERERGTPEEEERKRMLRVRATTCRKCRVGGGQGQRQYRPLRGHHCSVCRKCVRKMDHHCPVIANCVGWGNYKYFLLMLIHSGVVCLFGAMCVVLKFLLLGWSQSSSGSEVLLLVVGLVAFLYSLILILFGLYHVHLTLRNVTTLENMTYSHSRSNRKNPFDVGRKENWRQVFGDSPLLWFVPVWSSKGDGYDFPVNEELQVSYIV
eukprot:TRINITY_DN2466_c0_g5_i1.p1 TRINITY_DN2466_c0_g5~~TRINITY_DN2466_c0_g5_i1.p1  ORF type:complete len:424 (-),score=137.86 TRINITY_DN2466_c0_g5_i1:77-1222(-)